VKDFCRHYKLHTPLKGELTKSINQWASNVMKRTKRVKNEETGKDNRVNWWYGFTTKLKLFGNWDNILDPDSQTDTNLSDDYFSKNDILTKSGSSGSSGKGVSIFNDFINKKDIKTQKKSLQPHLPKDTTATTKIVDDVFSSEKTKQEKKIDRIDQIKHYLIITSREHEDGDIKVDDFKNEMMRVYKYKESVLDDILEELSLSGEIYEPRPNIIRLSEA
jgi:hypothetical protein